MNPTQAKRLGSHLRRARERAGLSQAALADAIGVPNTTVLRLERGEFRSPRAELLTRIADELGLDLFAVYEKAGYAQTSDLPPLTAYLRVKYSDLPESAADEITAYAEKLARRHGVDLDGPAPGEDEEPEEPSTKEKGGTTDAAKRPTTKR